MPRENICYSLLNFIELFLPKIKLTKTLPISSQCYIFTVPVLDQCLQEAGTPVLGPVWVSCGGGFSPIGACKFLEEIILHLKKTRKDSRYHKLQVNMLI